mgnify:CR=1 FL=1
MAVDIQLGATVQAGVPRALFPARVNVVGQVRNRHYRRSGRSADPLRRAPLGRDAIAPTTVVLNWDAELNSKRLSDLVGFVFVFTARQSRRCTANYYFGV